MKNMTVGRKILTGFMVVVLLIAIILAVSIVTSTTRNRDLTRVDRMTQLQQKSNELLYTFGLARIEIRTVFTSVDVPDEYYLAVDYLAACNTLLDEMRDISAQLDGYMSEDIDELDNMFADITARLVTVGDNSEQVVGAIGSMVASGTLMAESSTALYDRVAAMAVNMIRTDAVQGAERVQNALIPIKALDDEVTLVRLLSRNLMYQLDRSVVPAISEALERIAQKGGVIRAGLTTDEARVSMDALLSACQSFGADMHDVDDLLNKSNTEIGAARTTFDGLNTVVSERVMAIAQEMTELNDKVTETSTTTSIIMAAITAVSVILAIIIATKLGRMITRPLQKMQAVMLQAGQKGDLHFSDEVRADIQKEAQARDEIGQSLKAFTGLIDHISSIGDTLGRIAAKDLSAEVNLLSDSDTMGLALKLMLENLNSMFSEINAVAQQVSSASHEIAMGAQSLAQGSTEQAATLEEVNASSTEINNQMSESSSKASEAAHESEVMSQKAQEGNALMLQMTDSMREINNASQAIGQVIKIIDDIAFQTNILALNAAVEAARAGSHGKGFAVVAEEVRSLAGKSADAAKETSTLISSNIEKARQGLAFAEQTAESLSQITEGINKNSQSLQFVSQQSDNTKAATQQVGIAIEQVAQVVQQNSATSQENAASSQELSSQAKVLQDLIGQFTLRSGYQSRSLPAYGGAVDEGDGHESDGFSSRAAENAFFGKY